MGQTSRPASAKSRQTDDKVRSSWGLARPFGRDERDSETRELGSVESNIYHGFLIYLNEFSNGARPEQTDGSALQTLPKDLLRAVWLIPALPRSEEEVLRHGKQACLISYILSWGSSKLWTDPAIRHWLYLPWPVGLQWLRCACTLQEEVRRILRFAGSH